MNDRSPRSSARLEARFEQFNQRKGPSRMMLLLLPLLALALGAANVHAQALAPDAAQRAFFANLRAHCGATYGGVATVTPDRPNHFVGRKLMMHIASCTAEEIRIPFAVDDNRSRTIIIRYDRAGLSVKHDHRHGDGTPEAITMYGGPAVKGGTAIVQSFTTDSHTLEHYPTQAGSLWIMRLSEDGQSVSYGLDHLVTPLYRFDLRKVDPAQQATTAPPPAPDSAQRAFFARLSTQCGARYEGAASVTPDTPGDPFAGRRLAFHVASCTADEIRIPFAVDDNRSRTIIVRHDSAGLSVKHDHRHADGTPDANTMYGGTAVNGGSGLVQSFKADPYSIHVNPLRLTQSWIMSLSEDGGTVQYGVDRFDKPLYRMTLRRVTPARAPLPHAEQEAFWGALQRLCGRAYAGRMTEGAPAETVTAFVENTLVMHVRECSPTEIRIPFHVGENRSRTWVLTRTAAGLRLKHDHRHQDGTEDRITQYGGDTKGSGSASRQEFPADTFSAGSSTVAATQVWTVEVVPGERFVYALRYRHEGADLGGRFEFDLTRQVPAPPGPWGSAIR